MKRHLTGALLLLSAVLPASGGDRIMEPKDVPTVRAAQDAPVSPDGRMVAFVVSEMDAKADERAPTSQGQELYLGLKKLGVPTEFVTHPREPHGFREPNHQVDKIERELAWFAKWGVK